MGKCTVPILLYDGGVFLGRVVAVYHVVFRGAGMFLLFPGEDVWHHEPGLLGGVGFAVLGGGGQRL